MTGFCDRFIASLQKLPGKWLVIMAAVLWSTGGGVAKCFTMDPVVLAGLRSLIAGLVMLPFLRVRRIVWDKWMFMLILSNMTMVVSILIAIRYTTAANALALQYTASMWIVLWNLLVLRRKLPARRLIMAGLMLAGIAVILSEPNTGSNMLGNLFGLLSGIGYAATTVGYQKAQGGGNFSSLCAAQLSAGILVLAFLLIMPGHSISVPQGAWPFIIYMGVGQIAGGYVLYLSGLPKMLPQRATALTIWEFILTPVWAFVLVGEFPTIYGVIGWILLLCAVLLESMGKDISPQQREIREMQNKKDTA